MVNAPSFPIVGIPKPDKEERRKNTKTKKIPYVVGIPVRREITEWFAAVARSEEGSELKKQWTLFILGMEAFMKMPITDQLSYFRVAGIHGFPLQSWDNAPAPEKGGSGVGDKEENGYCHHNTVAFPTWHRPYLMLFEQIIWRKMGEIIACKTENPIPGFKDLTEAEKDEWTAAADSWRFPYWDWAQKQSYDTNMPKPGKPSPQQAPEEGKTDEKEEIETKVFSPQYCIPELCTVDVVPIWLPTGREVHPNPLAKFENPDKEADGKTPRKFGDLAPGNEKYNIADDGVDDEHPKTGKPTERMPWSECRRTGRWGIQRPVKYGEFTGLDGLNNFGAANYALDQTASNFYRLKYGPKKRENMDQDFPTTLGDAVARLFTEKYNPSWGEFASTKWYREAAADSKTGFLSLEYIHNNMHNLTGGSSMRSDESNPLVFGLGHMCDVPVAAFDPVFWLHHCNVDRLAAMWQALNWDKWWDKREKRQPDGADPVDPPLVPDFPKDKGLEPFYSDTNRTLWTSDACRDWTGCGYTYTDLVPEWYVLEEDGSLNEKAYVEVLRYNINERYVNTATMAQSLRTAEKARPIFGKYVGNIDYGFTDYVINVVYDRFALGGRSYSIRFYLERDDIKTLDAGPPTSDEDSFIGEVYTFGGMPLPSDDNSGCGNCKAQRDAGDLSRAQVAITIPLLALADNEDFGTFNSVERRDIKPYIEKHLHYKYVAHGGVEYPENMFPKTQMHVYAGIGASVPATKLSKAARSGDAESDRNDFITPVFGTEEDYKHLLDLVKAQQKRLNLTSPEPEVGIGLLSMESVEDESLWEW